MAVHRAFTLVVKSLCCLSPLWAFSPSTVTNRRGSGVGGGDVMWRSAGDQSCYDAVVFFIPTGHILPLH